MTRKSGGSDVTGRHEKRCSSSKQRFVSSRWLFFVQRQAMARWKASDGYVPNLTSKFFCIWMTRKSDGSDVTGRHGKRCSSSKQRFVIPGGYSSYRDKRWCVGKPVMSTFQTWRQKKFLLHLDHPKARGKWCHRRVLPWPSHLIYVVHRITQCCRWYRDER